MIDELLKRYEMTRYRVSKISGINKQTLSEANKNENVSSWKVKTVMSLSVAIDKTPGETLDELIKISSEKPIS